jgi:hypothetical protein
MNNVLKVLLLLALAVSVSKADDVTYAVNLAFGSSGTAIGTITTDGTQGVLNPSNIVSWNLTLTDYGTNSTTLITSNSTVDYGVYNGPGANDDLTASPTSLLFNYGVGDAGSWSFSGATGQGEFCITSWTNCFAYADTYGTWGINGDSQYAFSAASGIQTIGTEVPEVPEPSTLGLLGIGLVSIAGIVRKKVRYV